MAPAFAFAETMPASDEGASWPAGLMMSVAGSTTGKIDLKRGGDIKLQETSFAISQELPAGDDAGLSLGLSYNRIGIDQSRSVRTNSLTPLPEDLSSLGLDLTYSRMLDDRWSYVLSAGAQVANAGSGFSTDGLNFGGAAVATWQWRPEVGLSFGVAFDTGSENAVMPIAGVSWAFMPQWQLDLGFPQTSLSYEPNEKWRFSLNLEGSGGTYHVEKDPSPSATAGRPSLRDSELEYSDTRLGFTVEHQISETVRLELTAGTILASEFEYRSPKYKVKSDGGSFYGGAALNVSF